MISPPTRWLRLQICLILVCVLVGGVLAIKTTPGGHAVAPWWPGAGLGGIALLLAPRRWWPIILGGVLLATGGANLIAGRHLLPSTLFGVVDTLEVLVVVALLAPDGRRPRLTRIGRIPRLLAACAAGAAIAGLGIAMVASALLDAAFAPLAVQTFASHLASTLVALPLAMLPGRLPMQRSRHAELALQAAVLALATWLVFGQQHALLIDFVPIPLFIWAALRFGPRVVVAEQVVFTLVVLVLTRSGDGPFVMYAGPGPIATSTLFSELYLICIALLGLSLSVAELERSTTLARVLASEAVFRTNFAASPVPMLLLRSEEDAQVVVNANTAAGLMLQGPGRSATTYVGEAVAVLLVTDPPLGEISADLLSGRLDSWSGPVRVLSRPDAQIVMSVSANATEEQRNLVSAQFVDLTDAHEARERLLEEKHFSEAVLEITASIVVVTDLEGTVVSMNPALTRSTGFTEDEIVGHKIWERLREPAAHDRAIARFAPADATSLPTDMELDVMTREGGRRRMVMSNALARDSAGNPSRIVITAIDVTAERESAGLVSHVLRSATTTAFIGTDRDGLVTLFNTGAEQMLRIDAASARTRNICDFLDTDELARHAADTAGRPGFASLVAEVRSRHSPETRDWSIDRGTGDIVKVSMTTNEVTDSFESPIGFLFVLRDVTESRRSQEVLVQALDREREAVRRLRVLDAAKDDFVSTVSHELRTPMTSIIGFTELLQDGDVGALSQPQLDVVEKVGRNGERLLALADDLLGLAGFESGAQLPQVAPLDLCDVVRRVAETLRGTYEKMLDFSFVVPDQPVVLCGDPAHLDRALANLVGNAVKFTPRGGRVELRLTRDRDTARVEVSDTGIGIPVDELDAVFEKFFRSRNAQRDAIQGTGLGLAIVRSIVEDHHGSISVQSVEGSGTTFTVALPLARTTPRLLRRG